MRSSRPPGSYSGRGGLPLWRLRAGCAPQTAHGAITGATRPSNATPERSALKTTPVIGAPRHDRARGRNPPAPLSIYYHLPSAPILTVPIPNLPVSVAEKPLENFSTQPASSPDLNLMDTQWLENVSMIIFANRKGISREVDPDSYDGLFRDLDLISRFCMPICSRDNEIREVALDVISKTVEGWLDGVGSPKHYRMPQTERRRLQNASNGCACSDIVGNTVNDVPKEYLDLVSLHLPIILRLSISCPFINVREKCQHILEIVQIVHADNGQPKSVIISLGGTLLFQQMLMSKAGIET
ncbi:hypothetical protein GEV33_008048 [Tenebrio molitor]|uniref:Uncharacterized protein n=1 Tax=Tenebrio molitor TaxID=7067 RepID=A0A8J6HHH3_TENMO|nr:hypothetical protein GEV33_008048 [Tenebrio molitor]